VELRRGELESALALAGVPADARVGLGFPDQEAALQLASLATRLAALFSQRNADIVLTHPYEGGHPDHDATSFAVHGARWLMSRRGEATPAVIEMAFYHAGSGGLSAQQFAPVAGVQAIAVPLSTAAWALKQRMLSAHASQAGLATQFSASVERFRRAPSYDFSELPNGGAVYYGSVEWGMTPARWCQLAADGLRELCWAQLSI
jgi:LmbE family N-acetylglucosaminyl deacetylase